MSIEKKALLWTHSFMCTWCIVCKAYSNRR